MIYRFDAGQLIPTDKPWIAKRPGSGPRHLAFHPNQPLCYLINELDSTVTKVTVYSDRAQVTREAAADVTTESKVYAFRHLPGWVDDGSVRVAATAGRIVDVRVERSFLAKATDKNWQQAEAEH